MAGPTEPSAGTAGPEGMAATGAEPAETAELRRLRRRIDSLDRRIVGLLNKRAELGRAVGRQKAADGRQAIRDTQREREVLLRVTMANPGPLPQSDLLAIYRRLMAATRALEVRDRRRKRQEREADE
jgi:chorismate mutase/prephenate dehydratase